MHPTFSASRLSSPTCKAWALSKPACKLGGWKDLNVLFEHPPEATKQIFEPQTYFNHQAFPQIALAHPPALEGVAGLRFLSENAMGELGYYSLLGQLISEDEAKTLGPAWLADRYLLYERSGGNDYTLVARTRWTSPETSLAFFRDYHTILAHKYPELIRRPALQARMCLLDPPQMA